VCCRVLQCVINVLPGVAMCCSVLQCVVVSEIKEHGASAGWLLLRLHSHSPFALQSVVNVLQCVAVCCSVLQLKSEKPVLVGCCREFISVVPACWNCCRV